MSRLSKEYTIDQDRVDSNVPLWGLVGPTCRFQHVLSFIFGQYKSVKVHAKDEIANEHDRLVITKYHL